MNANPAPIPDATPLLDIDEASVRRDGKMILDSLRLRVMPGQHTAIVGPNGAGKSTLVKLVARRIYPLARPDGRVPVSVFGRARWNVAELRSLLGIVSPALQREYTSELRLGVFEAVVSVFFAAHGYGLDDVITDAMRERARAALAQVGAGHLAGRAMTSLSTGEARRVLIARALVNKPRALLLDEPCAGLDMASRRRFLEHLRELARGGTTLLLVTHHIEEILPEVSQVLLLRHGRTFAQGTKDAVLTDSALSGAYGMPIRVHREGPWFHAGVAERIGEATASD